MYKVKSVTKPIKKEGFEYLKIGLILEGPEGLVGGSVYFKDGNTPTYNIGDILTIEEVKKNKDGSTTFRGISKVDNNDTVIPLLF